MADPNSDFYFSGNDLNALARDLRGAALDIGRQTAPVMVEIGTGIEERAKRIAGDYSWKTGKRKSMNSPEGGQTTQQVVDSIHGQLDGMYTYRIRAGEGVPLAALWELGNRGLDTTKGNYFWHPLFGDSKRKYWQRKHPFLRPAVAEDRRNITRKMESLWDKALSPYRLHPEDLPTLGGWEGAPGPVTTADTPGLSLSSLGSLG